MLQTSKLTTKEKLMNSTISVVAKDGIYKATTKAISINADVNEVYIYRIFEDKEHLFKCVFDLLDNEMAECLSKYYPILEMTELPIEDRAWNFFSRCWEFLLGNKEKCSYFIKYYYSHYYESYPSNVRKQIYKSVLTRFEPFFNDNADMWRVFNHVFDVVFSTIIKILRHEIDEDDRVAKEMYELLGAALKNHFAHDCDKRLSKSKLPD